MSMAMMIRIMKLEERAEELDRRLAAAEVSLRARAPKTPRAREEAVEHLRRALAAGPRLAREVVRQATEQGFALRTVYRAAERLCVHRESVDGEAMWRLPDGNSEMAGTSGEGSLRDSS